MKTKLNRTPIALAVAALLAAPVAFAGGDYQRGEFSDYKSNSSINSETDNISQDNHTDVSISKSVSVDQDVKIRGGALVVGIIPIDASAMAVTNNNQINNHNKVTNTENDNTAGADGNALNNASGNIGLNITAGDNNMQANTASLATTDASFLFGSTDAEVFAFQDTEFNRTKNIGTTNSASIGGNVLNGASGNIGVNVSAGNSNVQKNDLAMAVGVSRFANANISVKQQSDHNTTTNAPQTSKVVDHVDVTLTGTMSGKYAGISDQNGNQYPDIWTGSSHPGGTQIGHVDLDTAVQGASDRPVHAALDANGQPTGPTSTGGSQSNNEEGDVALSGSLTGQIPVLFVTNTKYTTNTASLGMNVLNGASGNIGVNIAAGTNNHQFNGLAVSAVHTASGGGGGSGSGGETTVR